MKNKKGSLRGSKNHWLLHPSIPDIDLPIAQLIREVNTIHSIPFGYTGTALLSPEGQMYAKGLFELAGRCLGGGVLASRDLEWIASGKTGEKPGDYVPEKKLFGVSKEPQSILPSEWIAFEFGILLRAPFGSPLLSSWDDILSIAKVRAQGNDTHLRIDGNFGGTIESIFMQANKQGINDLMKIANVAGVLVYS